MSSSANDRPPLQRLTRDSSGFFQPDPLDPWLGVDIGDRYEPLHLQAPKLGIRADVGLRLNRGDGKEYGVPVHYVGVRFFSGGRVAANSPAREQGRMIGAVLAPHRGQIPTEANFYCACDSVDEDITQVARVLLDQYSVEELFGCGSLFVLVEHEFVEGGENARQEAALRLAIDCFARRWKGLRRVAVQVAVPSFNREALPTDPPPLQLRYREALAAELARLQKFHLSPEHSWHRKTRRHRDLLFSLDRRFDPDESIVELLRKTGQLPPRPRRVDGGRQPTTDTGGRMSADELF